MLVALAVTLCLTVASVRPAAAMPVPWTVVPSADVSGATTTTVLSAVAAVSAMDVWAVGSYSQSISQTLTEQWNGVSWRIIPSPNVGGSGAQVNQLNGVAAVSATDVWAVGTYYEPTTDIAQTLIEQWTGGSWSIIASPDAGGAADVNNLFGVAALTANDVWAVGTSYDPSTGNTHSLIEQWDGLGWNIVPSPDAGGGTSDTYLTGVAVDSLSDAWAVGYSYDHTTTTQSTLIEHWNGSSWSIVSSPNAGGTGTGSDLSGVAALSATDVWAVGNSYDPATNTQSTLTEQWAGSSWSIVSSPSPAGTFAASLNGVTAMSPNDIWAVGSFFNTTANASQVLIEQWEGLGWHIVPSPNVASASGNGDLLSGVVAVSSVNAWTVGNTQNGQTLTEHYGYFIPKGGGGPHASGLVNE